MTSDNPPTVEAGGTTASCLFEHILGDAFERLPRTVQQLHAASGARRYHGVGDAEPGSNPVARLCCVIARLPPAHSGPMYVDMTSTPTDEHWVRRFGTHRMPSHLRLHDTGLSEHLGPLRFVFELSVRDAVLHWRVRAVHVLGLALPGAWFAGVGARESERDGRYRFAVFARLPLIGLLVHYHGWLDVDTPAAIPDDARMP